MTRLNQIIAIEKGQKTRAFEVLTNAHQTLHRAPLLSGISRTYRPKDEEGEQLPPESTKVQVKAEQMIDQVREAVGRLFDVTLTKETANARATADVVVDGRILIHAAPVTYLLFLEKQLIGLHTFIKELPILDASEQWAFDQAADVWATEPSQTVRTKKIPRNHVKAEATNNHPAQVEVYHEDVPVGYWRTVKSSGALPAVYVNGALAAIEKLQEAVKIAREEANNSELPPTTQAVGEAIFEFVFDQPFAG